MALLILLCFSESYCPLYECITFNTVFRFIGGSVWPRIMNNELLNAFEAETGEQWMLCVLRLCIPVHCTLLCISDLFVPKIFYHFGNLQMRMPPYRSHFESFVFMRNNSIQRRRFATEQVI
jgi:hypothetical protein